MLVALGAAVFAGERLSAQALTGLALVCAGIMGSASAERPGGHPLHRSRRGHRGLRRRLHGDRRHRVRLSGRPASYVVWMTFIQGAPMPLVYLLIRRRFPPIHADRETWKSLGGGLIGVVSYGVGVWAMSATDMAKVSGLRETSILFAAILGAIFLKERFTRPARPLRHRHLRRRDPAERLGFQLRVQGDLGVQHLGDRAVLFGPSASSWNFAASRPGTFARSVRADRLILNPPPSAGRGRPPPRCAAPLR